MKRRIVRTTTAAAALALAIFLVPLAIAATVIGIAQTKVDLERAAQAATLSVGNDYTSGDTIELPPSGAIATAVYEPGGTRAAGSGPVTADPVTQRAASGAVADGVVGGELVVAVPVSGNEQVVAIVRSARPIADIATNAVLVCVFLIASAAAVLLVVLLFARRNARAISGPVERLADQAARMGDDPVVHEPRLSGIAEIDEVQIALAESDRRLRDALQRESRIAVNASHQLRTPLAGMRAILENAVSQDEATLVAAARSSIDTIDQLDRMIDDVLDLTRGSAGRARPVTLSELLRARIQLWSPRFAAVGRPLALDVHPDSHRLTGPRSMTQQVVDVLLENALLHGAGRTSVTLRTSGGVTAIDVSDDGFIDGSRDVFADGVTARSSGLGLGIARRAAEDAGARLLLASESHTRFTLLLAQEEGNSVAG